MDLWLLACGGALVVLAARTVYKLASRPTRREGEFTTDRVSHDWLASARIHEDQN